MSDRPGDEASSDKTEDNVDLIPGIEAGQATTPITVDSTSPSAQSGGRKIPDRLAGTWASFRSSRMYRPAIIGVPMLVLLGVSLSIYLPWELSKVPLPDLTDMSLSQAEAALNGLDVELQVDVVDRPPRDLDRFWNVEEQNPPAGTRVLPESTVELLGELIQVTIPSLDQLSTLDEAEELLLANGLFGEVEFAFVDSSSVPGLEQPNPDALSVFLSEAGIRGEARYDEPFPAEVDSSFLSTDLASVIIPSNIAGTTAQAGSSVSLIIVPPVTVMPSLVGLTIADAEVALGQAYLNADFGTSEDWYTVESQEIPRGELVMIGSGLVGVTSGPNLGAFRELSGATWSQIIKNPDGHIGTRAILYGEVVQFDVNTGTCSFRMSTGPARTQYSFDYDQNTYVNAGADNCDLLGPIVQDDHLKIWVTVTGAYNYSTTLGGTATALELDIWAFNRLPAQRY